MTYDENRMEALYESSQQEMNDFGDWIENIINVLSSKMLSITSN